MSANPDLPMIAIAAAAREAGLSAHTLRMWEQRYGFPAPARTAAGERLYPPEQVQKLVLLRRLIDLGHRPGRIAPLPAAELERMLAGTTQKDAAARLSDPETYRECLSVTSVVELRRRLRSAFVRQGLARFILETLAPLTRRVGEWWAECRIDVYQEHLFTQEAERLLREMMAPLEEHLPTKVILTTLPSERHGLGLLMAEALLRLEGAACLPMGVETPPSQIAKLAAQSGADVVALSFSAAYVDPQGYRALAGLRQDLPATVALWAGGAGAGRVARAVRGVDVLDLAGLAAALHQLPARRASSSVAR